MVTLVSRLKDIRHCGIGVANGVSAELHIETAKGNTGFIHHVRAEVVRPASQNSLAQSQNVGYITSSSVVLGVEAVVAVEEIPPHEVIVAAELAINFFNKVKTMARSR